MPSLCRSPDSLKMAAASPVGGDRFLEPLHLLKGQAEVVERPSFAEAVAGLAEDGRGDLMVGDCFPGRPASRRAWPRQCQAHAFAVPVASISGIWPVHSGRR